MTWIPNFKSLHCQGFFSYRFKHCFYFHPRLFDSSNFEVVFIWKTNFVKESNRAIGFRGEVTTTRGDFTMNEVEKFRISLFQQLEASLTTTFNGALIYKTFWPHYRKFSANSISSKFQPSTAEWLITSGLINWIICFLSVFIEARKLLWKSTGSCSVGRIVIKGMPRCLCWMKTNFENILVLCSLHKPSQSQQQSLRSMITNVGIPKFETVSIRNFLPLAICVASIVPEGILNVIWDGQWGYEKFHKSSALIKFGVKHFTAQVNPPGRFACDKWTILCASTGATSHWQMKPGTFQINPKAIQ